MHVGFGDRKQRGRLPRRKALEGGEHHHFPLPRGQGGDAGSDQFAQFGRLRLSWPGRGCGDRRDRRELPGSAGLVRASRSRKTLITIRNSHVRNSASFRKDFQLRATRTRASCNTSSAASRLPVSRVANCSAAGQILRHQPVEFIWFARSGHCGDCLFLPRLDRRQPGENKKRICGKNSPITRELSERPDSSKGTGSEPGAKAVPLARERFRSRGICRQSGKFLLRWLEYER